MATWMGPAPPVFEKRRPWETLRMLMRLLAFLASLFVLLPAFWIVRLIEWPFGSRRGSNFIIWITCKLGAWLCGIRVITEGTPMTQAGARVCNHSSWLDVFVLRSAAQMFFVAKAEVRGWPLLGFVADQTGTMFIERKRIEAKRQEEMFARRLSKGHRLCFFPEGTSSDGVRVLPFKSSLFSAFMSDALRDDMWIQPVTVFYAPLDGFHTNLYGWYGDIDFGAHLLYVLAKSSGGCAKVIFHEAKRAKDFPDRKSLSQYCEDVIAQAHLSEVSRSGYIVAEVEG